MSGATGQRGATGSSGATVSSAAVFADRSGVSGALSLGSAIGTSGTEVLVRTITVAQPSRLVGTGAATLAADGGSQFAASCGFYVTPSGGSEVRGGDETTLLAPSSQVSTLAVVGGIAVPAGTHTVRLRCSDASSQQAVVLHATFAVVATADAG